MEIHCFKSVHCTGVLLVYTLDSVVTVLVEACQCVRLHSNSVACSDSIIIYIDLKSLVKSFTAQTIARHNIQVYACIYKFINTYLYLNKSICITNTYKVFEWMYLFNANFTYLLKFPI